MKFNTKAIHGGQQVEKETGALATPIFQTSAYAIQTPGVAQEYTYSRGKNPTRTALENKLAAIENGSAAFAFSSGLAAIDCVLRTLKPGDQIITGNDLYGGTYRLFADIFDTYGLQFIYVDLYNVKNITDKITDKTKLIWLETPTNPLMKIVDIKAVSNAVHQINSSILVAVDNTFATPYLQQPLSLGADIVMHSVTKYLGGHSDLIMGALIVDCKKLAQKLHFIQFAAGAIAAPMDSFLALRGIKTLHIRMQRHCENANKIAHFLKKHPKVDKVYYPGFKEHLNYEVVKRQMKNFGGTVSFELKDKTSAATICFLKNTQLFTLAESLGGVESLVNHSATMSHASIPKDKRLKMGITDSLLRLSVGIEDVDDLIVDLQQALTA